MDEHKLTFLNIVINATLFLLKFVAGAAAGSYAILADAVNSLLDTIYGVGVYWAVGESHNRAEKGHHFHHGKAEPMVGFGVAVLTGIAAFFFLQNSLLGLISFQHTRTLNWLIAASLIIAILGKILLGHETHMAGLRRRNKAMLSTAADTRSDVIITLVALAGLVFAATGLPWMDHIATIIISLFLFGEAYRLGKQNVQYLTGETPHPSLSRKVRELVSSVRGVRGIHTVKVHYVGHYAHVQIVIGVSGNSTTKAANAIAHAVQHDIELLDEVSKAFVAVEPA